MVSGQTHREGLMTGIQQRVLFVAENESLYADVVAGNADPLPTLERVPPEELLPVLTEGDWALVVIDAKPRSRYEAMFRDLVATSHATVICVVDREVQGIECLRNGASDYVITPVSIQELTARILTRLAERPARPTMVTHGVLTVDLGARTVEISGEHVELAPLEFDLLAFLASRPGETFSREQLLREVWGGAADWRDIETVTEHVYRIRHKIEPDPASPQWLLTVRRVGYRFEA